MLFLVPIIFEDDSDLENSNHTFDLFHAIWRYLFYPHCSTNAKKGVLSTKAIFEGLPVNVQYNTVKEYFSRFGKVVYVHVPRCPGGDGEGYVIFQTSEELNQVLMAAPHKIGNTPIIVRAAISDDNSNALRNSG